ncbi:MAG: GNAT family N-acetyltransferase [Syntrophorhabdaceae bacterium]|nr:GNAT family N-acetyltransferase [Syntrophorhabdaceae bacterium]MDD5245433.1 GNAT family N-acetyltransferase [Syntrophorhabdaceae bacterium]
MVTRSSTLIVPNDIAYLPAIQAYAREIAENIGFQKMDVQMMLLALEEAIVNVVKHAFEPSEKATYQIILEPVSSGLRIIIKDKGLPYAPSLVPEYITPTGLDDIPGAGLGSYLMKKGVDELAFYNLGREGKELHLTKYLPYKSIEEYHDKSELELFPAPVAAEVRPVGKRPFTVRLMEASEAAAVSRLFYRAYGYTYSIDAIYYPEKFARLVQERKIISVVTVTDDDQIVGHVALIRDNPEERIAEAGMAAVQPDFRGQGCQNIMIGRLVEEARKAGLMGIFSKATTEHIYAQKAGLKVGFRRCAVAIGVIPADRTYKGIHEVLSQRGSLVYGFLPIENPPGITLFPPEHHTSFIRKICQDIGIDRVFEPPAGHLSTEAMEEHSEISVSVIPGYNRAIMEIQRYGKNAVSDVRTILKELCIKKIDEILLHLCLENPCTGELCSKFEELGFFIAGILPFYHTGDALILQYLNNVSIDYSKIQVAPGLAQEILDYVKAHDPN